MTNDIVIAVSSNTIIGVLAAALVAVVGWLGRRAIRSLDEIVEHLRALNHRTEKLEERMTASEIREDGRGFEPKAP